MTSAAEHPWGRVDAEGRVFVKTGDSEREIGEWKVGEPAEGKTPPYRSFYLPPLQATLLRASSMEVQAPHRPLYHIVCI